MKFVASTGCDPSSPADCACPVKIKRAASWLTVSSTWPAKKMIAVSTIAPSSATNIGATSANSMADVPRRLRQNQRHLVLTETVETAGGIKKSPEAGTASARIVGEIHCRMLVPGQDRPPVRINVSLTKAAAGADLAARAGLAHRRAGKHLAVVAAKHGDQPVRFVTARRVRRMGVDHAAQRERKRPGLARAGQSLGLPGPQLERRRL